VVTFWRGVGPTRAAMAGPALAGAVASASTQQPTRKAGKNQRKVRAS